MKAETLGIRAERPPSRASTRLFGLGAAWALLYVAGPGIVVPDGLAPLAPLGFALWAHFASRPGRGAFWIEVLLAGIAWSLICSWAALVHWTSLIFIGPGFGLYFAFTGLLLRALATRYPLVIAAPAAWMAVEALRSVLEPPFGLNWMRLGIHFHGVEWLSGSARVWGVWGLSWIVAAVGGALADLVETWRSAEPSAGSRRRWALVAGAGPLLLGAALGAWTRAPRTEPGPRTMLVQPNVPQERKMGEYTRLQMFQISRDLTARGIEAARKAGEPPPDLVAWGEAMLPLDIVGPGLAEAVSQGAKPPPWADLGGPFDQALLSDLDRFEDGWVRGGLLGLGGRSGVLPPGTAFVSGVVHWTAREGVVGRQNSVVLWDAAGKRGEAVGKAHLVPGAETMLGLERYEGVRSTIRALAGYVPDQISHVGGRTIRFRDREEREHVFGASVCFDNAYDGVFVEPLLEGPLDFHLVASNEAWFLDGQEMDQMIAFSRLAAIASGRSVVRATNSGISAILDPEGRAVAQLVVGGRSKAVEGVLRAEVPVPVPEERARLTWYVRTWRWWPSLALLAPLLLFLAARLRGAGYRASAPG